MVKFHQHEWTQSQDMDILHERNILTENANFSLMGLNTFFLLPKTKTMLLTPYKAHFVCIVTNSYLCFILKIERLGILYFKKGRGKETKKRKKWWFLNGIVCHSHLAPMQWTPLKWPYSKPSWWSPLKWEGGDEGEMED